MGGLSEMCTGIQLKTNDGSVVNGRTVEFGVHIPSSIAVVPRGYAFVGETPHGSGLEYTAKHAAVGAIALKDVKILDGLNDAGLAVGAFYFPGFAEYTPVTALNQARGLSPADFTNWLLTQFSDIDEVRKAVESEAVVITPTIMEGWGSEVQPFHYVVYDKTGASLVIEPIGGKLVVHDNPLGIITNSPGFDWHMTNLRNYISLSAVGAEPRDLAGVRFNPLGQGSGLVGLPGDFTPPSRFVRAAVFTSTATPVDTADEAVEQVFHILNNFDIPVGAARSVDKGVVHSDYTMLTTARDPQNLKFYFKSYEDQTIRMVDLKKFDLNAKSVKLISTRSEQPIVDISGSFT